MKRFLLGLGAITLGLLLGCKAQDDTPIQTILPLSPAPSGPAREPQAVPVSHPQSNPPPIELAPVQPVDSPDAGGPSKEPASGPKPPSNAPPEMHERGRYRCVPRHEMLFS